MEYKGRKILKSITARLISENNALPDCMCEILLTDDMLYVLEDEYNGEYTAHYAIPCNDIYAIDKYVNEESGKSGKSGKKAMEFSQATHAILAVMGVIIIPGKNSSGKDARAEYLRITYRDIRGEKQMLFFNETDRSVRGFIKTFEKLRDMDKRAFQRAGL